MSAALSESKKNPDPNPLPEEKSYRCGEVSPRESDDQLRDVHNSVFWKSCEWDDPKLFVEIGQVDPAPIKIAQQEW